MEKIVRLKICTGDKRNFGDDITNLGPLIPFKTQEAREHSECNNPGTASKGPFKNPSASSFRDENEE